jgi:hypothetical protein
VGHTERALCQPLRTGFDAIPPADFSIDWHRLWPQNCRAKPKSQSRPWQVAACRDETIFAILGGIAEHRRPAILRCSQAPIQGNMKFVALP